MNSWLINVLLASMNFLVIVLRLKVGSQVQVGLFNTMTICLTLECSFPGRPTGLQGLILAWACLVVPRGRPRLRGALAIGLFCSPNGFTVWPTGASSIVLEGVGVLAS